MVLEILFDLMSCEKLARKMAIVRLYEINAEVIKVINEVPM